MHRHIGKPPRIRVFASVGHLGSVHIADLRTTGFDRDHARNQIGTLIGDVESDSASLRMGDQDYRTSDLVEQCDTCGHGQLGLSGDKLHLALDEVIEDWIAHLPLIRSVARPLRIQVLPRKIAARRSRSRPDLFQLNRRADPKRGGAQVPRPCMRGALQVLARIEEGWQFLAVGSELKMMLDGATQVVQALGRTTGEMAKY